MGIIVIFHEGEDIEAPGQHPVCRRAVCSHIEITWQFRKPRPAARALRLTRLRQPDPKPLQPRLRRLPQAVGNLRDAHRAQAVEFPGKAAQITSRISASRLEIGKHHCAAHTKIQVTISLTRPPIRPSSSTTTAPGCA